VAEATLTIFLLGCDRPQRAPPSPASSHLPIYHVADVGKKREPALTPGQLAWIARIRRTPYFAKRMARLLYIVIDQPRDSDPPLIVFLAESPTDLQGPVVVDHAKWGRCNPHFFDDTVNAETPGCEARLPSPVR
jgi:hypothetical protein